MSESLIAVVFGVIQGITEFFPISSSGHLLFLHSVAPIFDPETSLSFDVAIHLATAMVMLLFFGRPFLAALRAAVHRERSADARVFWALVVGTIPASIVGYFFEEIIETIVRQLWIVGVMLILGGVLFILVERMKRHNRSYETLSLGQAFVLGIGQACALIPGVSRSGATIITGMALGLKRDAATQFAFLLGVPIILIAATRRIASLVLAGGLDVHALWLFTLGFMSAGIVGGFAIRWLLAYVKTRSFVPFAIYRIFLGIAILLFVV
jgi:undecaprenyl-diphosphatase